MIGRLDFLVAFGLAAGVHVAGFGYFAATGGFEGAGTEGRAALSLQAASPGIAELVAEWDAAPNVAELRETIDAPDAQTAFTKVNAWTDTGVVRSVTKLSDAPDIAAPPDVAKAPSPTLAMVTTQSPSAPRVARGIKVARMTTPIMPMATVPAPMPEPLAEVERAVLATPRPPVRPKRRDAAPAIVARGTGGGVSAGNLGATQAVATIAPAARAAAQAAWAQSIQKRIARHQSYPRGARGAGRVRLHMDILADGRLGAVRIDRSSGVAAFDRAALRAARAAAPFAAAPDGLDRPRYAFAQWVNFSR